jgi:hypothetical protein
MTTAQAGSDRTNASMVTLFEGLDDDNPRMANLFRAHVRQGAADRGQLCEAANAW